VQLTQSYRVLFCTDVLRVVPLNQLKYQALIALVQAGPNLGLSCVSAYHLQGGRDDTQSRRHRKIPALGRRRSPSPSNLYLSRRQLAALL
jgi:hypothetical protein